MKHLRFPWSRWRQYLTRPEILLALFLALLTVVGLAKSSEQIGYPRDEAVYFEASRRYGAWFHDLVHDPGEAWSKKTRDRRFAFNAEHPPAMKLAAGLSARLLARAPKTQSNETKAEQLPHGGALKAMSEAQAMRLPAQILAGLGVWLLFMAGRRFGAGRLSSGLLAAGWFILLPRVFFHASLHTFDVPIAIATFALALLYLRSLRDPRYGWALGPALGVAIVIKHNALFMGPLLALHYYGALAWKFRKNLRGAWRTNKDLLLPLPLLSMALIGPLVAWALWPWMWNHPVDRIGNYFSFHAQHSYYNMEFLGQNYNRPPLPLSYPFVMTWATVPTVLLSLSAIGLAIMWRNISTVGNADAAETSTPDKASWKRPLPHEADQLRPLWLTLLAGFPLVLIAAPTIPIFGGTKHWLTAYPFFALAAAVAWGRLAPTLAELVPVRWRQPVLAAALVLVLGPSAWATIDGHPHNLSQYTGMVGGARGAAGLGLNRGFWGYADQALLRDQDLPAPLRVEIHDMHRLALEQYRREGRWPDWKAVSLSRANAALLYHELHMQSDEVRRWNQLSTTRPAAIVSLDDVPLTSLYLEQEFLEKEP